MPVVPDRGQLLHLSPTHMVSKTGIPPVPATIRRGPLKKTPHPPPASVSRKNTFTKTHTIKQGSFSTPGCRINFLPASLAWEVHSDLTTSSQIRLILPSLFKWFQCRKRQIAFASYPVSASVFTQVNMFRLRRNRPRRSRLARHIANSTWRKYTQHIGADAPAAIVVFLVAIPCVWELPLPVVLNEFSGIIGGVVGGVVVGLISGKPSQCVNGIATRPHGDVAAAVLKTPAPKLFPCRGSRRRIPVDHWYFQTRRHWRLCTPIAWSKECSLPSASSSY